MQSLTRIKNHSGYRHFTVLCMLLKMFDAKEETHATDFMLPYSRLTTIFCLGAGDRAHVLREAA